ncbi:transaldolase family protein [Mucisphaera calidilacus]|uniref:Transaldolase n=1 Tax=Mucisphaera calidilacus TaxID=2527982 RepID=A0A518BXV1_9BACT|nr:transaldolase family protein [Mucisphaera calidilacus]QDU71784.1 Transaldolase [Mucisphaera calidilacus]
MTSPLRSIVDLGTRLWLDSIDPEQIERSKDMGATGATSNPLIIADLIETGRFDDKLATFMEKDLSDEDIAWAMTNQLVTNAQDAFFDVWDQTQGNDGYVSFELDPLLEDDDQAPPIEQRIARYGELGKKWAAGQPNRMIKVPATTAGLAALEDLAAAGVCLNVTLIFSDKQYETARDAIWRGAQRRSNGLKTFKSVYSIFVSRVDVYTRQQHPDLSQDAQGRVGLVNAKRIARANRDFWADKDTPLDQEIVFASTGVKNPDDPDDRYISQLVGSDIQTNPPAINDAIEKMGKTYTRTIDTLPPQHVLDEIDRTIDPAHLEETLLREGTAKFADPHKKLLALIARKRGSLSNA